MHSYDRVTPECIVDLSRFPANEWRRSVSEREYLPFFTIPARRPASSNTFCKLRSVRCRSEDCPEISQQLGLYSTMYFCTISQTRFERNFLCFFCPFPCQTMSLCLSISNHCNSFAQLHLQRSPEVYAASS
jgi:hypothetical protein